MAAVQEGPWKSMSSGKKVVLAAGLSVGVTVGYVLYRHIRSSSAQQQKTEQSRFSMPLDMYRSIARHQSMFLDLGRKKYIQLTSFYCHINVAEPRPDQLEQQCHGDYMLRSRLKTLQENIRINQKSGAQVSVLPSSEDQNMVSFLLQGTTQQNLLARCALEKLANDSELINDVLEVPQTAFGRIIGRGGETLKLISRTSGARVFCPRERGRSLEDKGKAMITGTRQEVQRAKDLIMEKVMENELVRKRISQSSALRQKRKALELEPGHKPQHPDSELMNMNRDDLLSPLTEVGLTQASGSNGFASSGDHTTENSLRSEEIFSPASALDYSKFEIPSPDLSFQPGEHLEVYVSAVDNPQHFWIQIIGTRSLQLDKLTAEMNRFYSGDTLHEHRVEAIVVGDIVASPYRDYGTWNRARVLGILSSGLVDLYYVDFGDNGALPRDQLRSLRSDFLSLPYQAIECSLAEVHPAGDFWTEDALVDFERMTYCAQWKPLLAKLCSYSHTEMSSWPSVKLYDNSQGTAVDLGEELIRSGHAVSCQDERSGLRGDHNESRCLQTLLDDMAVESTVELSMSCISLSGSAYPSVTKQLTWSSSSCPSSVDIERADVDQNTSDNLMPPSSSLLYSTPSLSLSELVSKVTDSSGSVLSPLGPDSRLFPHQSFMSSSDCPSATHIKHIQEVSSVTGSSLCAVDVVTSALESVSLNSNVFLGTFSSNSSVTSSSELIDTETSLSTCSECVCSNSSSSSDGIKGVWYYLTSSQGSSGTSLNTTMPTSSFTASSSSCLTESEEPTPVTSSSVILLSSDQSSADDAEMIDGDVCEPTKSHQKCSVAHVSDCSSNESDVIYMGTVKSGSSDTRTNKSHYSTSKIEVKKPLMLAGSSSELSEQLGEGLGEKEEEVCEEAMLKRKVLELENMKAYSGDISVREAASISGSVDDVLEDDFN